MAGTKNLLVDASGCNEMARVNIWYGIKDQNVLVKKLAMVWLTTSLTASLSIDRS